MLSSQVLNLGTPPAYEEGVPQVAQSAPGSVLPTLSDIENGAARLPSYTEALTRPDAIVVQGTVDDLPDYVMAINRHVSNTERMRIEEAVGRWEWMSSCVKQFVELPAVKASGFSSAFVQPAVRAMATWVEALRLGHMAGVTYVGPAHGDLNRTALDCLGQLHVGLINEAARISVLHPDGTECLNDFAEDILKFGREMEFDRRMCRRLYQWNLQKERRSLSRIPR